MTSLWVLCITQYEWCDELRRSVSSPGKPLQVFNSQREAEAARDLLNPYYMFDLEVYSEEEFSEAQ